jgi:hypothetical protein
MMKKNQQKIKNVFSYLKMISKWILVFIVIFSLFFIGGQVFQNRLSVISKRYSQLYDAAKSNVDNVKLIYEMNYLSIFPMGKFSFGLSGKKLIQNKTLLELTRFAETTGLVGVVYPAKVLVQSYIDPKSLLPYVYKELIDEGSRGVEEKTLFYDYKNMVLISGEQRYKIFPQTFETLSCLYYLMKQDMSKDKEFFLNVNSNQANYLVSIKVESLYEIDLDDENLYLWLLTGKAQRRYGERERHRLNFNAYFAKDSNLPIYVSLFTPLGKITARLKNIVYENSN